MPHKNASEQHLIIEFLNSYLQMRSKITNIMLLHRFFSTLNLSDQASADDKDWILDKNAAVLSQRIIFAVTSDWIVVAWIIWLFECQYELLVELRGFHHIQIHFVKSERVVVAADNYQICFHVGCSRATVCQARSTIVTVRILQTERSSNGITIIWPSELPVFRWTFDKTLFLLNVGAWTDFWRTNNLTIRITFCKTWVRYHILCKTTCISSRHYRLPLYHFAYAR